MSESPISLRDETGIERFRGTQSPGGGSQSELLMHHTQLSDADIKALPSDGSNLPIVVSPVPDAGTMIVPSQVVIVGPSVAYTHINNSAAGVFLATSGGNTANQVLWDESIGNVTQMLGQSGSRSVSVGYVTQPVSNGLAAGGGDGADMNLYDGLAWQIAAYNGGDGDFQGGDPVNKLDIYFYYVLVPTV